MVQIWKAILTLFTNYDKQKNSLNKMTPNNFNNKNIYNNII